MKLDKLSFAGNFSLKGCVETGNCPNCNECVTMPITETSLLPKVYHIATKKIRRKFVAICPECHVKFGFNKKTTEKIKSTPDTQIFVTDLEEFVPDKALIDS